MRNYMSQKFRNLRRTSEPSDNRIECGKKMTSVDFATLPIPKESEDDELTYQRNVSSLNDEYSKAAPSHSRIYHLLKLTHKTRRALIEKSKLHSSLIKEQFPYFGSKKWVSELTNNPYNKHLNFLPVFIKFCF